MKNSQKGFVVALLIVIIALLIIGGGIYIYTNKQVTSKSNVNSVTDNQEVIPDNPAVTVTILSPNGGEKYEGGKTYNIKWSSNTTKNVDIGLIEGSMDSGQSAGYVALDIPNSGNYKWTIPSKLNSGQYRISVRPVGGGSTGDASDSTFTIVTAPLILTNSEALALVKATWGGCSPDSCSEVLVSVSNTEGITYVTATYEGLRDDSTSASRKFAPAHYDYGYKTWVLETPINTQRCQPGRGHQDFSSVPCI